MRIRWKLHRPSLLSIKGMGATKEISCSLQCSCLHFIELWLGHGTGFHPAPNSELVIPQPISAQKVWNTPDWFANEFTTMNTFSKVTSRWTMNLDILDALISRPFYEGRDLTVSPYGGVRGLWIHQALRIDFPSTNAVIGSVSKNRSQFGWGSYFEDDN
ncbi:MAG: hypothetical protein ACM3JI_05595 [Anaerolineae bacterium]